LKRETRLGSLAAVPIQGHKRRAKTSRLGGFTWKRRKDRTAFWHMTPQRLVVAVMAAAPDEPLLLSCAGVETSSQIPTALFASGLIEAARVAGALSIYHVVALDECYCHLVSADGVVVSAVRVDGCSGLAAQVEVETVAAVVELFADASLQLVGVDSAECARISLREFLGSTDDDAATTRAIDPLAAVSVTPECEDVATELASFLDVSIGLALSWYRLIANGHG